MFKTFIRWAFGRDNGYTYNDDFKKFIKKDQVITQQIALKKEDLQKLLIHNFEFPHLERICDVFAFACVTGLRFEEFKSIAKEQIIGGNLHLKEEKGAEKKARTIPLKDLALFLLRKFFR